MSSFMFRLIVVLAALGLPMALAVSQKNGELPTMTVEGIAEWSPVQGPSLMNNIVTNFIVQQTMPSERIIPEWATEEDRAQIAEIASLIDQKETLKAMGQAMILMSSLEDRDIKKGVLIKILLPDLSFGTYATIGSTVMLAAFSFMLVMMLASPWLVHSLGQAIALFVTFLVGIGFMFQMVWFGIEGMGSTAFNFTMIEYFGWAIVILLGANILIGIGSSRGRSSVDDEIMMSSMMRSRSRRVGAARPISQSASDQKGAPRQWGNSNLHDLTDD